jgi:hypothetical protein
MVPRYNLGIGTSRKLFIPVVNKSLSPSKLLFDLRMVKVKVKESRIRTGVTQRVPRGLGSQIFMTFGT